MELISPRVSSRRHSYSNATAESIPDREGVGYLFPFGELPPEAQTAPDSRNIPVTTSFTRDINVNVNLSQRTHTDRVKSEPGKELIKSTPRANALKKKTMALSLVLVIKTSPIIKS